MKYSRKQQIISLINESRKDNSYIVNKREEGQQELFICNCCKKEFNFANSIDYVGAVDQWKQNGSKCYACANGFCHCPHPE